MALLPEIVGQAWENREGPTVFATVDAAGNPNVIYVTCVRKVSEEMFVVADNFFYKTKANILSGSKGSLLFITKEGKSFQVKGSIEYHIEGAVFENMKQWNPAKLPGHAATVLKVERVYSGAEELT